MDGSGRTDQGKEFVVDRAFFDQLIPLIRVESGAD